MCCKKIRRVGNVSVTDTNVVLTFDADAAGIADTQALNFRLCQGIPSAGAELPVQVTVNGAAVPLWDRFGNPVLGKGLVARVNYMAAYGATSPHVITWTVPLPAGFCRCGT